MTSERGGSGTVEALLGLPEPVLGTVKGHNGGKARVLAWAESDVDSDGRYREAYAVLTDEAFCVLEPEGNVLETLPVAGISRVAGHNHVGGGRLELWTDGRLALSVRFTGSHSVPFKHLERELETVIETRTGRKSGDRGALRSKEREQQLSLLLRVCPKCRQRIPAWSDVCVQCLKRRHVLFRLLDYSRPYRKQLAAALSVSVLLTALQLVPPYLTKYLYDEVLTPQKNQGLLLLLVSVIAAVFVARAGMSIVRLRLLTWIGEVICRDLREETYEHLQKLSLRFYDRKRTGSLISRVSHDVDRLWDFLVFGVSDSIVHILTVIGIGIVLFTLDARLAALSLAPMPFLVLFSIRFGQRMRRAFGKVWRRWASMTSVLADSIPGARVVKAFAQEDRETERFRSRNRQFFDSCIGIHRCWTHYYPTIFLITQFGAVIVWWFGGRGVLAGRLTLGEFSAFLSCMWMFYMPIQELSTMNRMVQRAATSAQRVFEILDTDPIIHSAPDAVKLEPIEGRITFDRVTFTYDGIKNAIDDMGFEIRPGETIGLAGASGGGKTTLVNLICRFYDVTEGRVLIDGVDVRDLDVHSLRSQVGVVLQEPYLFHGTIAENVAYGKEGAPWEEIIAASKAANAHDFIVEMPHGYDTLVGERGAGLSGGEKQRISIARAILKDPRILILDEATSSVDTETEAMIQEAMNRLVCGRTTIAIAHRLSTLIKADRLFILEDGKIAEMGSHQELLEQDGIYARLFGLQTRLVSAYREKDVA